MSNPTVNFNTSETSTNSTTHFFQCLDLFLNSICFLFGFPTNSYVLCVILKGTESGVASEFFILNHFICEIGLTLSAVWTPLSFCFSDLNIIKHFFQGLGISGRPLFQCLMCVERYLAVVHPVTFLKYKPLRYRVICCAAVWIITLGSCLYCMCILNSENIVAFVWFFSPQFLVFLCIQLFCLVAVLRALKQSGPGERKREKEENHMKRKAFHLILITTVSVACVYVPYIITGFVYVVTQQYIKGLFSFSFFCYYLAGFVQPILYLHRAGKLSYFVIHLNR